MPGDFGSFSRPTDGNNIAGCKSCDVTRKQHDNGNPSTLNPTTSMQRIDTGFVRNIEAAHLHITTQGPRAVNSQGKEIAEFGRFTTAHRKQTPERKMWY